MRKRVLAIILILVVLAGAAAVVISGEKGGSVGSTRSTTTVSTTTPTGCTTTFPQGLSMNGSGNETRLFAMLPGTTALLCVEYTVVTPTAATVRFNSSVEIVTATYANNSNGEGFGYSYSYKAAPGLLALAEPSSVELPGSGNTTTVTVVYAITASANSTGFYTLEFTDQCPALIPFAVTSDWQEVGASDFVGFFLPSGCVSHAPISGVAVTGIAAMNTTLIAG